MNKGDRVKLDEEHVKDNLNIENLGEHLDEFKNSEGTVLGYSYEDTDEFIEVRWDCNLRYGYRKDQLTLII
jgi:hypothetical protein